MGFTFLAQSAISLNNFKNYFSRTPFSFPKFKKKSLQISFIWRLQEFVFSLCRFWFVVLVPLPVSNSWFRNGNISLIFVWIEHWSKDKVKKTQNFFFKIAYKNFKTVFLIKDSKILWLVFVLMKSCKMY